MKGEAFLLAAVIISVALVAMFQPMRSEYLIKQKQLLQSEFFLDIFENIFNEIKNSIYFSFDDFDSMIFNSHDFLNFSQKIANQRGMSLESLVIILKADGSNYINVSAINFFSEELQLNLTFNGTQNSILILPTYSINSTNFTYVSGETYTLEIEYKNIQRTIDIKTKINNEIYLAYIDVILSYLEDVRRKVEYFFMPTF